jgi:predicted NBD/HSP70 family sugar kinase
MTDGVQAATTPTVMRRTNATLVLQAVRDHGPLSRAGLARLTGLSKPTVNAIVSRLCARGYLREGGSPGKQERPGPRATSLSFVAEVGTLLALDLGSTRLAAMVTDLAGRPLAHEQRRLDDGAQATTDRFMAAVDELVEAALEAAGVSRDRLWSVGVGVPGFIDQERGSLTLAPAFAGWRNVPFRQLLASRFGCPVFIDNKVQLAVLAEQRWGAARDVQNAVYLHLGTGIGMGLLIRGEIFCGADGFAGEVGFMDLPDPADPTPDDFGSFEWAAGGLAYARLGRRAVRNRQSPRLAELSRQAGGAVRAEMVFEAAREGDTAARAIVATLIGRLATGVANICCVLNPEMVILGAGLSRAGAMLLDPLRERVAALVPMPPRQMTLSALGGRSTVLGAVERALRAVEDNRFRLFEDPVLDGARETGGPALASGSSPQRGMARGRFQR